MDESGFNVQMTTRRTVKRPATEPRNEREGLVETLVVCGETMHLSDLRFLMNDAERYVKDGGLHARLAEKHRRRRARNARPAELRMVQGPYVEVKDDRNENKPDFHTP